MTANQIKVGQFFIGHALLDDLIGAGKERFPGDKATVELIVPESESTAKELFQWALNQPTDKDRLWVIGRREKKSSNVKIIDWRWPVAMKGAQ